MLKYVIKRSIKIVTSPDRVLVKEEKGFTTGGVLIQDERINLLDGGSVKLRERVLICVLHFFLPLVSFGGVNVIFFSRISPP